jgi:hypothetical protein
VPVQEAPHERVPGAELRLEEVREEVLRARVKHSEHIGELPGGEDRVGGPGLGCACLALLPDAVALHHEAEEVIHEGSA